MERICQREPVVLVGYPLCPHAVERWTFDYLSAQMSEAWGGKAHAVPKDSRRFQPIYGPGLREGTVSLMSFMDFASKSADLASSSAYYLQMPLVGAEAVEKWGRDPYGPELRADVQAFDWPWLEDLLDRASLGGLAGLRHVQLWIGRGGALTPCHHDKLENVYVQIRGCKRFLLIPPEETFRLYPYPVEHPLDAWSMVDFEAPCGERFPGFAQISGSLEVVLEPGDVLYLPKYWWHHVSQGSEDNISLNFWCEPPPPVEEAEATGFTRMAAEFARLPPRCRALRGLRLAEDFSYGAERSGALPEGLTYGRFLTHLAEASDGAWPEEAPEAARLLGEDLRRLLAELLGGQEAAAAVLKGTAADGRLYPGPPPLPPADVLVDARKGSPGGWLREWP